MQPNPDMVVTNVCSVFLTRMGMNRERGCLWTERKLYNLPGCASWEDHSVIADVFLRPLSMEII